MAVEAGASKIASLEAASQEVGTSKISSPGDASAKPVSPERA